MRENFSRAGRFPRRAAAEGGLKTQPRQGKLRKRTGQICGNTTHVDRGSVSSCEGNVTVVV